MTCNDALVGVAPRGGRGRGPGGAGLLVTRAEKFALARALHEAQMFGYPPQAQAWIRQQFTCVLNALVEALRLSDTDARRLRQIVNQDNFTPQDNPFTDD